jgi:hypothetical protein
VDEKTIRNGDLAPIVFSLPIETIRAVFEKRPPKKENTPE